MRNMWSTLDFQIACPKTQWTQGKSFIILFSDVLVGHILIQNFFHQTVPTWNWMSLWHWVSAILAGTSQLLQKTFSAVSLPFPHLESSHKGARSREVSGLVLQHRSCGCDETQVVGFSEISLTFLKLYPWAFLPLLSKARGPVGRFFKKCRHEIQVLRAMHSIDPANLLLWLWQII